MTNTFDEVSHPRERSGQFAEKPQSQPEATLPLLDDDPLIRALESTDADELHILSQNPDEEIAYDAVANVEYDPKGLRDILSGGDDSLRFAAAGNPSTPPGALAVAAEKYGPSDYPFAHQVSRNPSTPWDSVVALSKIHGGREDYRLLGARVAQQRAESATDKYGLTPPVADLIATASAGDRDALVEVDRRIRLNEQGEELS